MEYSLWYCPQVQLSTLPPEPFIASKKPFKVELVGGKRYSWCTCGHSKKQVKLSVTLSKYTKNKKPILIHSLCIL